MDKPRTRCTFAFRLSPARNATGAVLYAKSGQLAASRQGKKKARKKAPDCSGAPYLDQKKAAEAVFWRHSLFRTRYSLTLRAIHSGILRRQLSAHGVEAGLLIVAERIVEVAKRRLHRLDTLQHGLQALADRLEPRRRGWRHIGRTSGLDRVGGLRCGRLQGLQLGALRVVGPHHAIDLIGRPRHHAGVALTANGRGSEIALRGLAVTRRARGDVIEPRFLLVVERIVEGRQRRTDDVDRIDQRTETIVHLREPPGRRKRDVGLAMRPDLVACFDDGITEIVEHWALPLIGLHRGLDLID